MNWKVPMHQIPQSLRKENVLSTIIQKFQRLQQPYKCTGQWTPVLSPMWKVSTALFLYTNGKTSVTATCHVLRACGCTKRMRSTFYKDSHDYKSACPSCAQTAYCSSRLPSAQRHCHHLLSLPLLPQCKAGCYSQSMSLTGYVRHSQVSPLELTTHWFQLQKVRTKPWYLFSETSSTFFNSSWVSLVFVYVFQCLSKADVMQILSGHSCGATLDIFLSDI